jgi:hypothetical protein
MVERWCLSSTELTMSHRGTHLLLLQRSVTALFFSFMFQLGTSEGGHNCSPEQSGRMAKNNGHHRPQDQWNLYQPSGAEN